MALVGEAEVTVVANTEEFDASMASLGAEGDLGAAGLGAGATTAGEDAGKDITKGVESETSKLEPALAEDGALAGVGLRTGVTDETGKLADDVGEDAEETGANLEKGIGDHVSGIRGMLSGLGIPESLLSGPAVAAEAFAGLSLEAFHLQNEMQKATTAISTTEGISVKAADEIGTAFLHMTGEFSGKDLAESFSAVAGQLKAVNGQALTTKQSIDFMATASQLATASQTSLGDATSDVATVLQAFTLNSREAGNVSNILFNTANATGIGLDGVTNALTKLKSALGGLAPPLGETSGLLLDLTNHGETGRKAVSAVSTGFTAFLKPVVDQITAQKNLKIALDALPPSLKKLADGYTSGSISGAALYKDTENLSGSQYNLFSQFESAANAVQTAGDAQERLGFKITNAKGALLPMSEIIGKLHDQIKGMSDATATATLSADGFGSSAAKWVKTVQAGPEAFNKATEAVQKHNAVVKAAEEQQKTFDVAIKTLLATVEDVTIEFGQELAPVFHDVLGLVEDLAPYIKDVLGGAFTILGGTISKTTAIVKDIIDFFKKGSIEAKAVGAVLVGVLTPAFIALGKDAVGALKDMAASAVEWAQKTVAQIGNVLTGNFTLRGDMEETAATSGETTAAMETDAEAQSVALEGVGASEEDLAATSEAVAPEVDSALGPIGIAIAAIAIAALLLKDHWKQVWDFMKDAAEDAWHFIDSDVLHPIKAAFEDVVDFIKSHWELLVGIIGGPLVIAAELIYKFRGDIEHAFEDIIHDMEHIGEDIVKGLVDGIKDAAHLAVDAAKDVAHGIEHGVKDILSIFSPSRVMHDAGVNVSQGLADGIRDRSGEAERAAREMALKVQKAATPGGVNANGMSADQQAYANARPVEFTIKLEAGAVVVHATNLDAEKTERDVQDLLVLALRQIGTEMKGGVSALGRVSA